MASRPVPAFQNLLHLQRNGLHIVGRTHLDIERIDAFHANEILLHRDRNQHGFGIQFGLSETVALFFESADYGELQAVNFDGLPDGALLASEQTQRQFVGQERDVLALRDIAAIEEPPGKYLEVADGLVIFIRADHQQALFLAVDEHQVVVALDARGRDDSAGQLVAYRLDIGGLNKIGGDFGVRLLRADFVGREDHVRSDAFDFLENIVLARKRDGDDQDYRCRADHHSQACQERADGVLPERLNAEAEGLA